MAKSSTDLKHDALVRQGFQGTTSDMMLAYLRFHGDPGAPSLADAWGAYLDRQGVGPGAHNDRLYAYLGRLPPEPFEDIGSLNGRLHLWYKTDLAILPEPAPAESKPRQLSVVDNAIELAKGDLYVLKCRALGVVERAALPGESREELEHFCALLSARTAEKSLKPSVRCLGQS